MKTFKPVIRVGSAVGLLLVLTGCARTARDQVEMWEGGPEKPAAEGRQEAVAPTDVMSTWAEMFFAARLEELLPGIGAPNLIDRQKPQQALEELCFQVGLPGSEVERGALCRVMCRHLDRKTPKPARVWLLRQLERISHRESVPAVAPLLRDRDEEIRDLARRVLQNNPSAEALAALRAEFARGGKPERQVALINALAARTDQDSLPRLIKSADSANQNVAAAAISALGQIGGRPAIETLTKLAHHRQATRREWAQAALLRIAERLDRAGESHRAAEIFLSLCQAEPTPAGQVAAWRGLVATAPGLAAPMLLDAMHRQTNPTLQLAAASLLAEIPGESITRTLVDELPHLPAGVKVVVLHALAARGDRQVKPVVIQAIRDPEQAVRLAALRALEHLGNADDVLLLAGQAAESEPEERDAARHALARLTADGIEPAVLAALSQAEPPIRAELIRTLSARRCKSAVPLLLKEATHPDEAVRIAAFDALGELASPGEAAALVTLLMDAEPEEVRLAAQEAVAAVCARIDNPDQQAEPVLAAWPEDRPAAQVALIGALGRIGGSAALEKVRAACKSGSPEVVDAAVRALSKWLDTAVLGDLLELASTSENPTHRILALQGFIWLLGQPSDREPQTAVEMYLTAMSLAQRVEERKAALSGLSKLRHLSALQAAEGFLAEDELRAEAEAAVISIAQLIGPYQPEQARAAVLRVMNQTASQTTRTRGQQVLDFIHKSIGCIRTWSVAGPFFQEGMEWSQVFDHPFPPELPNQPGVEWHPLNITNPDRPWVFDLTKLDSGTDRCVYVRCAVRSESERAARLEVGSDDAVKVWLNGQVVHEFKGARGHETLQDKLPVVLQPGWNTLLLKVVQIGGGWGFSCAVRDPRGEPLQDLEFQDGTPLNE